MELETERLILLPLSIQQMNLWVTDVCSLEWELGCTYRAEPMEGPFLDIVKGQIQAVQADAAHYLFYTFWFLLRKSDRVVIGSSDFKGPPNDRGEIEIGYGIGREFERAGFMTEAVHALCGWALGQTGVSAVIAETDLDNTPSHRVLKRCGFSLYAQQAQSLWWRLPRQSDES